MSRKQVYRLSESLMIQMPLPCGSAKTICICQLKSLEITLAGSLRREHVADASIKKLEAEIEHLNRLVIPFHLHCSIPTLCCREPESLVYIRFGKERKILGAQK